MTCIVGLKRGEKIYMGGDSAGVAGLDLIVRADQKVFKKNNFIFGFTSSFRMGQLLRFCFTPPPHHPSKDVYEYMVSDFVNGLRTCMKDGGFARKKDEEESGGTFLVGYKKRLFKIEEDYQVGESVFNFDSCGCGSRHALGALHILTKEGKHKPEQAVRQALATAQQFSAGVREPFHVLEL